MFLLEDICDALSVEKVKINKLSFTSLKPPTKNSYQVLVLVYSLGF